MQSRELPTLKCRSAATEMLLCLVRRCEKGNGVLLERTGALVDSRWTESEKRFCFEVEKISARLDAGGRCMDAVVAFWSWIAPDVGKEK